MNVPALKGIHYAVESGRLAAEAAFASLQRGETPSRGGALARVRRVAAGELRLGGPEARPEHAARVRARLLARGRDGERGDGDTRASSRPATRSTERDADQELFSTDRAKSYPAADGELTFDKLSSVFLSGNKTRDDAPNHIRVRTDVPPEVAKLWENMCPAHVYEAVEGGVRGDGVELRPVRRDHRQGRPAHPARRGLRPRVHGDVTVEEVLAAREAIGGRLHRTPMLTSATLSELTGARVHLKAELFQKTGSFKLRGVLTNLAALSPDERERGVISISAGNHAQALAWGARAEGIDALLVMWRGASEAKIEATRAYGAEVDLETDGPAEAFERLDELQEETGRTLVHAFDHPLTIAGQGTVGLEIVEDVPDADVLVVPVGGGGLISGIAIAAQGRRRGRRRARALAGDVRGPRRGKAGHGEAGLDRGRPLAAVRRRALPRDLPGARRGRSCS